MPKDRCTTTTIENGANGKFITLLQVETANILSFQFLGIVSLKHALPDNLKTYSHWQTTSPLHQHKY